MKHLVQVSVAAPDGPATKEERAAFFQFISLADLKVDFFTFHSVQQTPQVDTSFLLSIQYLLFSSWLDKMRTITPEATSALLSSIPSFLNQVAVLRQEGRGGNTSGIGLDD